MNRPTLWLLLLATLLTGMLPACNDLDENYSTHSEHRLTFSVDTLTFDTVFTTINSATKGFMIYNPNPKPLNISSIQLAYPNKSGFRINVDGQSGNTFSNISLLAKDSMYVFIEVTVQPTDKNQPVLMEDYAEFVVNGTKQSVLLQAYGQDAQIIKGGYIFTKDTTLTAERPYLIYDSIEIRKDVTLTIEKGASFYMHKNAKWLVAGTLNAIGTLEQKITFRGDRSDYIIESLSYDQTPGQWEGLFFTSESFHNSMDYVVIRNGVFGLHFEESTPDKSKVKISNTQITNMEKEALSAINCNIEATNSEFTNAKGYVASLIGGSYQFIHCTLVSEEMVKGKDKECLYVSNVITINNETKKIPLEKATFENSIIDGKFINTRDSLGGELNFNGEEGAAFNYSFAHCVVKTKKINNTNFVNTQFANAEFKPEYKQLGKQETKYIFDFRPVPNKDKDGAIAKEQLVIGQADRTIAAKYPVDMNGIDRLNSEDGPDIGAYEYVPDPQKK